jgi:hypothetical protein
MMTGKGTLLTIRGSTAIKNELVAFHVCQVTRSEKTLFVKRSFGGFLVIQVTAAEESASANLNLK